MVGAHACLVARQDEADGGLAATAGSRAGAATASTGSLCGSASPPGRRGRHACAYECKGGMERFVSRTHTCGTNGTACERTGVGSAHCAGGDACLLTWALAVALCVVHGLEVGCGVGRAPALLTGTAIAGGSAKLAAHWKGRVWACRLE